MYRHQKNLVKMLNETQSFEMAVCLNTGANNCQHTRIRMCQVLQSTTKLICTPPY